MAEVLGIVGSIIAIIQLTGKVASLGYDYVYEVRWGSKDLGELLKELGSLTNVLITLKDYADANLQSLALQRLNDADGPIRGCTLDLKRLQAKLEPKTGYKRKIDRLTWPFKENEIAQHMLRIERHKSLFTLAITLDQM